MLAHAQERGEFGLRIDPAFAAGCILGAGNRIAIHRSLGVPPERLVDYEKELLTVMFDTLKPVRRRRRSA
jgi:hypothetical protein